MRQLASVQKIVDIHPIPGYDRVEYASVLGWHCVVKKGEFKVGDLAIYIEVDSQTPSDKPCFAFLEKYKYRVKTQRLCRVISQGIVLPVKALSEFNGPQRDYSIGEDVTGLMGITKYDPELVSELEPIKTTSALTLLKKFAIFRYLMRFGWFRGLWIEKREKGGWPDWLPHTDSSRIQSDKWILEKYKDTEFEVREKIDGQSASYFLFHVSVLGMFRKTKLGVCSRTIWKKTPHKCSWYAVAEKYSIREKMSNPALRKFGPVAIQGEIIGPSVQGGKYKKPSYEFYVFDVFSRTRSEYLSPKEMAEYCSIAGLEVCPLLDTIILNGQTVDGLVMLARGNSKIGPCNREGIVLRPAHNTIYHPHFGRLGFKVIDPILLIENGE